MNVKTVYDFLDRVAPYNTQCKWDNSGIIVGSMSCEVSGVALALDCMHETVEQAKKNNCNLIVCHHPLIFKPVSCIDDSSPIYDAIKNGMNVISFHTNFDMASGGVNDVLCDVLELKNIETIIAEGEPLMRSGIADGVSAGEFALLCAKKLDNGVKLYDCGRPVKKVAVCGGAGGEYVFDAVNAGCDTFVTGEAKHHEFLNAANANVNLITAGHYSTENPAMQKLTEKMLSAFPLENIIFINGNRPYETVI